MIFFFLQGCYDKLEEYIKQNGIIIGTAAIVTAVFMVNNRCNTIIPASKISSLIFIPDLKTSYIYPSTHPSIKLYKTELYDILEIKFMLTIIVLML